MPVRRAESESENLRGLRKTILSGVDGGRRARPGGHVAQSRRLRQGLRDQFRSGQHGRTAACMDDVVGCATRLSAASHDARDDSVLILPPASPVPGLHHPIPRGDWQFTVLPKGARNSGQLSRRGCGSCSMRTRIPGLEVSEWEMRGARASRSEPKDIEKAQVCSRAGPREKLPTAMDGLAPAGRMLAGNRRGFYERAFRFRDEHTQRAASDADSQPRWRGAGILIAGCAEARSARRDQDETRPRCATSRLARPRGGRAGRRDVRKCGHPSTAEAWFSKAY